MSEGCGACENRYTMLGDSKCRLEPHRYDTPIQRAVVRWLSTPLRDAFRDGGCPGFSAFEAESKTGNKPVNPSDHTRGRDED